MIGSVLVQTRLAGLAMAAAVIVPILAAPAAAQGSDTAPSASAATTDACAPGGLGQGGAYTSSSTAEGDIIGAEIAYQCMRTLDDGTYVPEGYRVTLSRACPEGTCELPLVFASAGAREGTYRGTVDVDGKPVTVQIRSNRNGALVVSTVSGEGRGAERERNRYTLRPSS